MEDNEKVNDILKALNGGKIDGDWIQGDGFYALMKFSFSQEGGTTGSKFHDDTGYPVKFFVNYRTAEVKFFSAALLRKK